MEVSGGHSPSMPRDQATTDLRQSRMKWAPALTRGANQQALAAETVVRDEFDRA